jgi:hypothetical protein
MWIRPRFGRRFRTSSCHVTYTLGGADAPVVLSELLGRTRGTTPILSPATTSTDREDDVGTEPSEVSPALLRATRSVWGPAADSYERLIEQLNSTQVTADAARKIWPVSVAILLVTLATRRQIARCVAEADIPPVAELVGRFLRAVFADRHQGWRHGLDGDDRVGPTDPSVAAILHENYSVRPTEDIAGILRLLFAFQHASSERSARASFLDGWLLFQEIAPEALVEGPPSEEYVIFYRRYLLTELEGLDWPQISASWQALSRLGWVDHPGFQELRAIACYVEGGDGNASPLPARFRELWQQTERRIRNGKPWRCTVSRLDRYCKADNCPLSYSIDPTKRELAQLRPVICRGCGSVLVPDRLAHAFGEGK